MSVLSSTPDVYKNEPLKPISWRAVLVAFALIPLNTYWISISEIIWLSLKLTVAALPLNVIFILCGLLLLQRGWPAAFIPGLRSQQRNCSSSTSSLASSSALSGYDSVVGLVGTLPHTTWYASPENDWEALFGRHLPKWLIIADYNVARSFYLGEVDFFDGGYWQYWLKPALSWMAFVLLLVLLLLCITVLLRRPWTEQEKLTYPIIQLPLEMSNPATRLFQNRLMWMGFAVAAGVDLINGLNFLYPSVPEIPTRGVELHQYFTSKPWSAMGPTYVRWRFFMIGMTYLLPLEMSVSCWVSFGLSKRRRFSGVRLG